MASAFTQEASSLVPTPTDAQKHVELTHNTFHLFTQHYRAASRSYVQNRDKISHLGSAGIRLGMQCSGGVSVWHAQAWVEVLVLQERSEISCGRTHPNDRGG